MSNINDFVIESGVLRKYSGTDSVVEIPKGVTTIGSDCFFNCVSMKTVKIPDTVETVEKFAFFGCTSLMKIDLPESVTYIGQASFGNCENLKEFVLPNSLETLCSRAFERCSSLVSINIPESLDSIPAYCFQFCTSLDNVAFPSSLKRIAVGAFLGCDALSCVTIPEDISFNNEWTYRNKDGAFKWCSGLKSLTLHCPFDAIDTQCFEGCKNLREVFVPAEYAINNTAWWKERFAPEAFDVIALENFDKTASLTKFVVKDRAKCIKSLIAKDRLDLISKVFEYSSKPTVKIFDEILEEISSTQCEKAIEILLEYKNANYKK